MRHVICHYHIFKNSGTTFDKLLSRNYGDKHICFDGPFPFYSIDQEQLERIIGIKSDVVAFSSHQIRLPVPVSLDYHVLPVVFIRHPLLRVQSIYKFKRQSNDGTVISTAAQKKSFDEWVTYCFDSKQNVMHISNSQTAMLGGAYRQRSLKRKTPAGMEYDLHQAVRNMQNIQFIARTEYFNDDVSRFSSGFAKYDINFRFEKIKAQNTTSNDHKKPIEERLAQLEQSLSERNVSRLWGANEQDIALYDLVTEIVAP